MKLYQMLSIAALALQISACGGSGGTSAKTTDPTSPSNPQQNPTPGGPGSPTPTDPSPYKEIVTQVLPDGSKNVFHYVEALDRVQQNTVELRFFTKAPRTMCSPSTFLDSSWFQPDFSFATVRVLKTPGATEILPNTNAKIGKRGEDFEESSNVSGEIVMHSVIDHEYTGWITANLGRDGALTGNFKVRNCSHAISEIRRMGIDDLYNDLIVRNIASGKTYEMYVSSTTDFYDWGNYEGYINHSHSFSMEIKPKQGTPEELSVHIGGQSAGKYFTTGNNSCEKEYGSATTEFDGNTLYFNQANARPFFCRYDEHDAPNVKAGFLTYDPVTKKRKVQFKNKLGTFETEF